MGIRVLSLYTCDTVSLKIELQTEPIPVQYLRYFGSGCAHSPAFAPVYRSQPWTVNNYWHEKPTK